MQVAKPMFSFPLADYAAKRTDLVLRGRLDRMVSGDAWGANLVCKASACTAHPGARQDPDKHCDPPSFEEDEVEFCTLVAHGGGMRADVCMRAGFDSQMMLVRNTLWSRRFFRQAAKLMAKPELVADVRSQSSLCICSHQCMAACFLLAVAPAARWSCTPLLVPAATFVALSCRASNYWRSSSLATT